MTQALERSLIRIFHSSGLAEGVGVLVDSHHALTCAHVVATALGLNAYPENPPLGELTFDFPLIAPGQKIVARVVTWKTPATGQGDMAVLEITSSLPEKAEPARLIQAADLWEHHFRVFGFPKGHENGTWATGRILGAKAGGWQQIESTEQTGYFVQPGFSGGPVWDESLGGVVGIIMEAETATRAAFMSPVDVLAAAYPPLTEQIVSPVNDDPALGESPFKGLLYFEVKDAPIFFGRETLTEELSARLFSSPGGNGGEGSLLAIVGASGSGKSSLVRAGLIPTLMSANPTWIYRLLTPTAHPLKELAIILTADVETVTATTTLIDDLAADFRSLDISASRFIKRQNASHLLLVVDQFEELFTSCKDLVERKAFINNLLYAALPPSTVNGAGAGYEGGNVILLLALRADFYHHCAQYDNLRSALETYQAYIGPMNVDQLRYAIEAPLQKNRWGFETGLVDVMLHDVKDEPGALPLLSHALLETWRLRKGHIMTLSGYHAAGGVRGAIAQTADRLYKTLPTNLQRVARDIFFRLTELGEGTSHIYSTPDTRRRVTLDELIPVSSDNTEVEAVLKKLADARLVMIEKDCVVVTHEALIRQWPALREWLDENRDGLRLHRHLTETANAWLEMGCDDGELYRGTRLNQTLQWIEKEKPALNRLEHKFIEASQKNEIQRQTESEFAQQRELEQEIKLLEEKNKNIEERKQARAKIKTRNQIVILLAILTMFPLIILINLYYKERIQANTTKTNNLSNSAEIQIDKDFALATLLSIEAYSTEQSLMAQRSLFKIWQFNPSLVKIISSDETPAFSIAFSPNGQLLASGSEDGNILLWNVTTGQLVGKPLLGHKEVVWSVAFSPNGKVLASGSEDGTIRIWEVNSNQQLGEVWIGNQGAIKSIAFSPDGLTLFTASLNSINVWDLKTRRLIEVLPIVRQGVVTSEAFSLDGKTLASGSYANNVSLWDVQTGKFLGDPLLGNVEIVQAIAFNPEGRIIASGSKSGIVRFWDIFTSQEIIGELQGDINAVVSLAFSPDGQILASSSSDSTIRLWNATDKQSLSKNLGEISSFVDSIAFSPNGKVLASGSKDGTIRIWDLTNNEQIGNPIIGHTDSVNSLVFSPDGQLIASGARDGTIRLWDVASHQQLNNPVISYNASINSVVFSPDGQLIASGTSDGIIRLWDVTSHQQQFRSWSGHLTAINSVIFSPDGQILATGGDDGMIKLWDVESGKPVLDPIEGKGSVKSLVFSPDGQILAAGTDENVINMWLVNTGKPYRTLIGHTSIVTSVDFSPDGRILASGSNDGNVQLWDTYSGQTFGDSLTGDFGSIYNLTFSSDGQTLAAAGCKISDGLNIVIDSASCNQGEIRLWNMDPKYWLQTSCQRIDRNLTEAEWNRYLDWKGPYDPNHKTCPQWPSTAELLALTPTLQP